MGFAVVCELFLKVRNHQEEPQYTISAPIPLSFCIVAGPLLVAEVSLGSLGSCLVGFMSGCLDGIGVFFVSEVVLVCHLVNVRNVQQNLTMILYVLYNAKYR